MLASTATPSRNLLKDLERISLSKRLVYPQSSPSEIRSYLSTMTEAEHEKKSGKAFEGASIIVRNLAKSVTDDDLHAHFGGIGPIRVCFIVKDSASRESRRYGFVRFALPAHSKSAIESLHHSTLAGRRVTVEPARRRTRVRDGEIEDSERKTSKKAKLGKRSEPSDTVDADHRDETGTQIHTEPESKLKRPKPGEKRDSRDSMRKKPAGNDGDSDAKRALRQGSVPMRTVVLRRKDGSELTEESAKGAFRCMPDAESAIEDIVLTDNGKTARVIFEKWAIAGKAAAKVHGKELDAVVDALRTGERTTAIVRNLPFRLSRKLVEDVFTPVASVRTVRLAPPPPSRKSSTPNNGSSVGDDTVVDCGGYAFVEFFTVSDAKHAIKQKNGTEIGGRTVAIDMALSKSQYNNNDQVVQRSEETSNVSTKQNQELSEEVENDVSEDDVDNVGDKSFEENDIGEKVKSGVNRKEAKSSAEELARTIFVRNLLFETKAHVVWREMEQHFGAVEQAVIVRDRVTQMSKGKAFVRFVREEDAHAAVRKADRAAEVTMENGKQGAKLGRQRNMNDNGLWIDGRRVYASIAMDRGQANATQADRLKQKDVRNLNLLSVGFVARGSAEGEGLTDEDWAIRDTAERNKRVKLKRNPNTFVSDVRLCVLNLPRGIDEKVLKAMFTEAAISDVGTEDGKGEQKKVGVKNRGVVRITHCTIVRDGERKDRSKGFGFITFEKHEHALRALQNINNNKEALEKYVLQKANKRLVRDEGVAEHLRESWGGKRRLIVEFAVEDVRQVRLLDSIKKKGRQLREQHRLEKEHGASAEKVVRNSDADHDEKSKHHGKRKRPSQTGRGGSKTRVFKKARHKAA